MKNEYRQNMLQKREALSLTRQQQASAAICRHLAAWLEKNSGAFRQVFLYLSHRGEPNLLGLFNFLPETVVTAVPVVRKNREMFFAPYRPGDRIVGNRYGILEPAMQPEEGVQPNAQTLILVPALAIDARGHRLGYGGGYYDRYLRQHAAATAMGVIYDDFFLEKLPSEDSDVALKMAATEKGLKVFF